MSWVGEGKETEKETETEAGIDTNFHPSLSPWLSYLSFLFSGLLRFLVELLCSANSTAKGGSDKSSSSPSSCIWSILIPRKEPINFTYLLSLSSTSFLVWVVDDQMDSLSRIVRAYFGFCALYLLLIHLKISLSFQFPVFSISRFSEFQNEIHLQFFIDINHVSIVSKIETRELCKNEERGWNTWRTSTFFLLSVTSFGSKSRGEFVLALALFGSLVLGLRGIFSRKFMMEQLNLNEVSSFDGNGFFLKFLSFSFYYFHPSVSSQPVVM